MDIYKYRRKILTLVVLALQLGMGGGINQYSEAEFNEFE